MFRKFLRISDKKTQIRLEWVKKINGLVRVVIPDPGCNRAFVVIYYEKQREYTVIAFDVCTGEIYWSKNVINGGYGAPALLGDMIIVPTQFTNIVALSKDTGTEIWELKTKWRLRSSINVVGDKLYFSSGGTLFEASSKGHVINEWVYPKAFFYGSVDRFQDLIISLGTVEDEAGESVARVFAFHLSGQIAYVLPIFNAPVISSDTSGITWQGGRGFVGGNNLIKCFEGTTGQSLWTSPVNGFAGRQVCTVDENRVYYTTQSGVVGALNIVDGSHIWNINTHDKVIVSPVSIINDNLIVLADAHLNVLKSENGQLVEKIPVGHSPYGMLSLHGEYGLLGAGEPPHNGLLFAFKLANSTENEKYTCVAKSSNALIENSFFDVVVNVQNFDREIVSLKIDGGVFNLNELVIGEKMDIATFAFRLPLPKTINSGDYVIPVYLEIGEETPVTRSVLLKLEKKTPFPLKAYLHHVPDIIQDEPTYSGAAIGAAIKRLNGDSNIQQSDIRKMVDYSRNRSGYEPFQTWRILLRRILTCQACKKENLSEFHQN